MVTLEALSLRDLNSLPTTGVGSRVLALLLSFHVATATLSYGPHQSVHPLATLPLAVCLSFPLDSGHKEMS